MPLLLLCVRPSVVRSKILPWFEHEDALNRESVTAAGRRRQAGRSGRLRYWLWAGQVRLPVNGSLLLRVCCLRVVVLRCDGLLGAPDRTVKVWADGGRGKMGSAEPPRLIFDGHRGSARSSPVPAITSSAPVPVLSCQLTALVMVRAQSCLGRCTRRQRAGLGRRRSGRAAVAVAVKIDQ